MRGARNTIPPISPPGNVETGEGGELYILLVLLLLSLLFLEVEASGLSLTQGEALGMTAKGHIHQQYNELFLNHSNTSRKNKADFISFLKMKILLGNLSFC